METQTSARSEMMDKLRLQSFCSFTKITAIIGEMSAEKIQLFKDLGFGGLLEVPFKDLQRQLCTWLLFNYDGERQRIILRNGRDFIPVDLQSIGRILGLPTTGTNFVVQKKKKCTDLRFKNMRYNLINLEKEMRELEVGLNLQKCMLIFVCATVINPTARMEGQHQIWDTIWQLEVLEGINWGQFCLETLNKAAKTLMDAACATGGRGGVSDRTYMHGCVYVLQYLYLTSTYIPNLAQPQPEEMTDDKVRRRIAKEISLNKVYGNAILNVAGGGTQVEIVDDAPSNVVFPPLLEYNVEPASQRQQTVGGTREAVMDSISFLDRLKSNFTNDIAILDVLRGNLAEGLEILDGLRGALIRLCDAPQAEVRHRSPSQPCHPSPDHGEGTEVPMGSRPEQSGLEDDDAAQTEIIGVGGREQRPEPEIHVNAPGDSPALLMTPSSPVRELDGSAISSVQEIAACYIEPEVDERPLEHLSTTEEPTTEAGAGPPEEPTVTISHGPPEDSTMTVGHGGMESEQSVVAPTLPVKRRRTGGRVAAQKKGKASEASEASNPPPPVLPVPSQKRQRMPAKILKSPYVSSLMKKTVLSFDERGFGEYVFGQRRLPSEELVRIHGITLTRSDFEVFRPSGWLDDQPIAMMAYIMNEGATSNHYFSPHVAARIEAESDEAMKNECQLIADYENEFISSDVNIVGRQVLFFPVCRDKHWHLHVINAKHYRVDLLSSIKRPEVDEDSVKLTRRIGIIFHLLGLFNDVDFQTMRHEIVDVPQQNNGDDCGMFVLRFMQTWNGDQLMDDGCFDYGNIDVERLRMAIFLIMKDNNVHRDAVLRHMKKDKKVVAQHFLKY